MATVQNIIDGVKWQVDLQVGNRLLAADLIPEVDAAYKEAWETIVATYEDYFIKKVTDFAITGGIGLNTYAITATDFFKLKGIQRQIGNSTFGPPLPTHEFNEVGNVIELSYRLNDLTVYFEPELSCQGTYRLWYIYAPADLLNTTDSLPFDLPTGPIKRFCIDRVAMRATMREEDDAAALAALQQQMLTRIQRIAGNRNGGRGRRIADVRRGRRFQFMTKTGLSIP